MNFYKRRLPDEPEINFIPLIDVLLVIIIFLMLTTTYARFSGLEITLPSADASAQEAKNKNIEVAVTPTGQVVIDGKTIPSSEASALIDALKNAAKDSADPTIVIHADAKATHQSVIDVMQAASAAGLPKISFATQSVNP